MLNNDLESSVTENNEQQNMLNEDTRSYKLDSEEIELLSANYSERILYYIFYPKYFLQILWESVREFKWRF